MLNKLNSLRTASVSEEGFTLIELIIVVVIIGILAAIAIPMFLNQQKGAINAGVKSDVRNANTAIATELVKAPTAASVAGTVNAASIAAATTPGAGTGVEVDGNEVDIKISDDATELVVAGAWDGYTIAGTNDETDFTYTFNSATGKSVES